MRVHVCYCACSFASTYQMLRGTLVLFAGCLTILILKRRLYLHHWLGMVRDAACTPDVVAHCMCIVRVKAYVHVCVCMCVCMCVCRV